MHIEIKEHIESVEKDFKYIKFDLLCLHNAQEKEEIHNPSKEENGNY